MATTLLDEETSKKVIRQVEFYFSDSNLPRDNFLKKTISENEDGRILYTVIFVELNLKIIVVSLALICSFSRMRTHLGLGDVKADEIPEDTIKSVSDTLRTSDFLKISDDGTKVGRITELTKPEEVIEQIDSRTISVSPLPYDVKLEDVESFFAQHAKVNSVRLPRLVSHKNLFCGTALIEFSTEEDLEKVLKQSLAYAGVDLEFKPKKDFDAEREKLEQEYEKSGRGQGNAKESEEANYPKGLIVAFKLNSKSAGDESKQNGSNGGESVQNGSEEADKASENDKNGAAENVEETKEEPTTESTSDKEEKETEIDEKSTQSADKKDGDKAAPEGKNAVESYTDNMDVVIREDLKAIFQKFGTVKASQKARAAAVLTDDGGLVVKNFIATLEPVTGNAEKEYWSQIQGSQGRFRDNKGHRGRGRKFNRGGRHGRRDRDRDSGRPNKAQKVAT
ncbi:La protein 1 [Bienertia sinuspersici]